MASQRASNLEEEIGNRVGWYTEQRHENVRQGQVSNEVVGDGTHASVGNHHVHHQTVAQHCQYSYDHVYYDEAHGYPIELGLLLLLLLLKVRV